MTNISLLPCTGSFNDFTQLRNMHRLCMRKNVEESLGQWDEEAQCARLKMCYDKFGLSLNFIPKDSEVIGTINFHPKIKPS